MVVLKEIQDRPFSCLLLSSFLFTSLKFSSCFHFFFTLNFSNHGGNEKEDIFIALKIIHVF